MGLCDMVTSVVVFCVVLNGALAWSIGHRNVAVQPSRKADEGWVQKAWKSMKVEAKKIEKDLDSAVHNVQQGFDATTKWVETTAKNAENLGYNSTKNVGRFVKQTWEAAVDSVGNGIKSTEKWVTKGYNEITSAVTNKTEQVEKAIQKTWTAVEDKVESGIHWVEEAADSVKNEVKQDWNKLEENTEGVLHRLGQFWDGAQEFLNTFYHAICYALIAVIVLAILYILWQFKTSFNKFKQHLRIMEGIQDKQNPTTNHELTAITTPAVTTAAITTPSITTPAITTPAITTPAITTAAIAILSPPVAATGAPSIIPDTATATLPVPTNSLLTMSIPEETVCLPPKTN